jgi:hypothetical protein
MWWWFRRQGRRIARICAWLPTLWNDEDWDEYYLLQIMRFKVSRMRKQIAANNRHVRCEKTVEQMRQFERLLEHQMHGHDEIAADQSLCQCTDMTFEDIGNGVSRLVSTGRCANCRYTWKLRTKRRRDIYQDNTWLLLCEHFRKHAQKWWD